MYATEFQTIINDPYVKIPEYESFKGKRVRIIVLGVEEQNKALSPVKSLKGSFLQYSDLGKRAKEEKAWQEHVSEKFKLDD